MKPTRLRHNPFSTQDFHSKAPSDLQVAADMALEGLARDPTNEGFYWVKPLMHGNTLGVDLLAGSGAALAKAGGDLTKLDPTLIPEGGVICPAGSFVMGSPEEQLDAFHDETPHREILTRSFAMGKYPVTQQLYEAVMRKNPSRFTRGAKALRRPVETVSWYDAVRFCNRLSEMLGLELVYVIGPDGKPTVTEDFKRNGFRLPTEAEWEYAARSGGDTFRYAGSDDLDEVGWYEENSDERTHAVGHKKPNRWGLYDMSGNVLEWVQDLYVAYPGGMIDYMGTTAGANQGARGGGWGYSPGSARVASRHYNSPSTRDADLGFRICRTLPDTKSNPRRRR